MRQSGQTYIARYDTSQSYHGNINIKVLQRKQLNYGALRWHPLQNFIKKQ